MENNPNKYEDANIQALLSQMTLKEKIALLSGNDNWATVSIDRLGIPSLVMTDGPHGVRADGPGQGRLDGPTTAYPTGISMGATWDPQLITRLGEALAEETRFMGCDILLGPCVNIVRTPLAGRNFETISEDPYLTGQIGLGYVTGLQSMGIGASLKHFACNNQEFERNRGNSVVDERTLREIYLPAFETVVKGAQPWTVMCSYNRLNGAYASENQPLLTKILKQEWGFEGAVISDWGAVHSTAAPINNGLDLEMPGPAKWFGILLEEAVQTWQVDEVKINQAATRILSILFRSGKMVSQRPILPSTGDTPEHRALARQLAQESITLLKNEDHVFPLDLVKIKKLAVVGLNATMRITGGGSSHVKGHYWVTPLEGLRLQLGDQVEIIYEPGYDNRALPSLIDADAFTQPDDTPGLNAMLFNNPDLVGEPDVIMTFSALDAWWGFLGPDKININPKAFSGIWEGKYHPSASGPTELFLINTGKARLYVDNEMVLEHNTESIQPNSDNFTELLGQITIDLDANRTYNIRVEYRSQTDDGFSMLHLGHQPYYVPAGSFERAVVAARDADAVLVFAGMPLNFESEGNDRPAMSLPGDQDALIAAIAAVNPDCAVVLNVGSPIEMPWAEQVKSILLAYYPGQEGGNAIADILLGKINPSGKLPVTFPQRLVDNPAFINYPGSKDVRYGEGIFVGYRYYDAKEVEPLFPFGHGLSYSDFIYKALQVPDAVKQGESFEISFTVKNNGQLAGKEVAQVYISDLMSRLQRPSKELKAFAKVDLAPDEEKRVTLSLDARALSYFDPELGSWLAEPGAFKVLVGSSSRDIRLTGQFYLY